MIPFQPRDRHTVIPRIITTETAGLVGFLKAVLDAQGDEREDRPTELTIGDSVVLISDGGGQRAQAAAFLYVYVPDADETYRRAIQAGAVSIEPPADMP